MTLVSEYSYEPYEIHPHHMIITDLFRTKADNSDISELVDRFIAEDELSERELERVTKYRLQVIDDMRKLVQQVQCRSGSCSHLLSEVLSQYQLNHELDGKHVIELGPGENPLAEQVLKFHASSYTGVESAVPERTKEALARANMQGTVVDNDALSYLHTKESGSVIIMSISMFAPELYGCIASDHYYKFLAREIYRVTATGAIGFHVSRDKYAQTYLRSSGFYVIHTDQYLSTVVRKPLTGSPILR